MSDVSLREFCSSFLVQLKPSQAPKPRPGGAGRKPNTRFDFDVSDMWPEDLDDRTYLKEYEIVLRSKTPVVVPVGSNFPVFKRHDDSSDAFAEMMTALFVPWGHFCARRDPTFSGLCTWILSEVVRAGASLSDRSHWPAALYGRVVGMERMGLLLRTTHAATATLSAYRARARTRWFDSAPHEEDDGDGTAVVPREYQSAGCDDDDGSVADAAMVAHLMAVANAYGEANDQSYPKDTVSLLKDIYGAVPCVDGTRSDFLCAAAPLGADIVAPVRKADVCEIANGLSKDVSRLLFDLSVENAMPTRGGHDIALDDDDDGWLDDRMHTDGPAGRSAHGTDVDDAPVRLSGDQQKLWDHVGRWCTKVPPSATDTDRARNQELILVHGSPGAGKTFVMKEIIKRIGPDRTIVVATSGVAASLLEGRTVHSFLGLNVEVANPKGNAARIRRLTSRLVDKHVLVLDEVSMLDVDMLVQLDQSLKSAQTDPAMKCKDFGGLTVFFVGDFLQIPPIGCQSLIQVLIDIDCLKRSSAGRLRTGIAAAALFQKFVKFDLNMQMRAGVDAGAAGDHARAIANIRNRVVGDARAPLAPDYVDSLRPLSRADMGSHADWDFAPIAVTSNKLRSAINLFQATRFAKQRGVPIIVLANARYDAAFAHFGADDANKLLHFDPAGFGDIFVAGAPAMVRRNVCPAAGIANGSRAELHSLVYYDRQVQARVKDILAEAGPGQIVVVQAPDAVLVDMTDIPATKWSQDAKKLSTDGSRALIPLLPTKGATGKDASAYGYNLGFSFTFHKLQGLTMDRVVLDLRAAQDGRSFPSAVFSMVYVGLTRVRSGAHIRVLINEGGKTRLKKLRDDGVLKAWLARYDKDGRFK